MGLPKPLSGCFTNYEASAPNPNPGRWELLDKVVFKDSYALKVRYLDVTNFEGVKVMVFRGRYEQRSYLDPHFEDKITAPIARFRPDDEGWEFAIEMARSLSC